MKQITDMIFISAFSNAKKLQQNEEKSDCSIHCDGISVSQIRKGSTLA